MTTQQQNTPEARRLSVEAAVHAGQLDSNGIPPTLLPESYRGIHLRVVRDYTGAPLVAFDGNGRVVFLGGGVYQTAHDWPTPGTQPTLLAVLFE